MRKNNYYIKLTTINTNRILHTLYRKTKLISIIRHKASKHSINIYGYVIDDNTIELLLTGLLKSIKAFLGEVSGSFSNFYNTKEIYIRSVFKDNYYYLKLKDEEEMISIINYLHLNGVYNNDYHMISRPNSYHEYINKSQFNLINKDIKEAYLPKLQSRDILGDECKPKYIKSDVLMKKKLKKTVLDRVLIRENSDDAVEALIDGSNEYSI